MNLYTMKLNPRGRIEEDLFIHKGKSIVIIIKCKVCVNITFYKKVKITKNDRLRNFSFIFLKS